jgi:hypothetical protein
MRGTLPLIKNKMNKPIIVILLTLLIFSCTDNKQTDKKITELERLQTENDSLKKIVKEISNKYVFDSISFRDIDSFTNTYEINSIIKGELVIVGYNNDIENTNVIMFDSISYNPKKLFNPDTLKLQNGGYHYEMKMDAERVYWRAEVQINHKYGKNYEGVLINAYQANKN